MAKKDKLPPPLIPKAAATRISLYLRYLEGLLGRGEVTTSSQQLGAALGVTPAQVRKDLGYFGQFGFPGVGYKISNLIPQIRRILGTHGHWNVALVGMGNLGSALVQYRGFEKQGFRITALFDNNPALIGKTVGQRTIRSVSDIPRVIQAESIKLAIITVPAAAAQSVADQLVSAGIRGIFNFAPAVLTVPEEVGYVSIDLSVELEQLSFFVTHREQSLGRDKLDEEPRSRLAE
jgi:redox-sensing transcriptional repressor